MSLQAETENIPIKSFVQFTSGTTYMPTKNE